MQRGKRSWGDWSEEVENDRKAQTITSTVRVKKRRNSPPLLTFAAFLSVKLTSGRKLNPFPVLLLPSLNFYDSFLARIFFFFFHLCFETVRISVTNRKQKRKKWFGLSQPYLKPIYHLSSVVSSPPLTFSKFSLLISNSSPFLFFFQKDTWRVQKKIFSLHRPNFITWLGSGSGFYNATLKSYIFYNYLFVKNEEYNF